ncbi:hypothetical protein [Noviherbaspirillum sp.]|uniref:hypothetical protein n=1 Tax=Noviherbaspirillum sp. TaxID=1926288 RepID=UPI0025EB3327|nr:hypothetical protein [Noviherbaspirillum sp.]
MRIKPSVINEQINTLEIRILDAADRLKIDLSDPGDRAALLHFQDDLDIYCEHNIFSTPELLDGETDATYFLSLAFNLLESLRDATDEEKVSYLGDTFFIVGLVAGIIGDDRANKMCPTCIARSYASSLGKHGADAVHNKPNGSREKRAKIQAIWASGKYSNRDLCAEEECAAIGMSFSAARKALRGTPDPVSRY